MKKWLMILSAVLCLLCSAALAEEFAPELELPYEMDGYEYYEAIKPPYTQGYSYSEGRAWLRGENGLFGSINKTGEQRVPFVWKTYLDLGEGYSFVTGVIDGESKRLVIDKNGNSIFEDETLGWIDFGGKFSEGYTWANLSGKYVIISSKGEIISFADETLTPCSSVCDRRIMVRDESGAYGYVNLRGELVIPCQWYMAFPFSEGYAAVCEYWPKKGESRWDIGAAWLFINKEGKELSSERWFEVRSFCNGRAAVCYYGWGYINRNGGLVIPYRFSEAGDFYNNRAPVGHPELDPDMAGFVDGDGQLAVDYEWERFGHYSDGLVPLSDWDRETYESYWFFGNKYGKTESDVRWAKAGSYHNGAAIVYDGEHYGFVDTTGSMISECQWDEVMPFSEGLAWVKNDEVCGFINEKGVLAVDCKAAQ